MTTQPVDIAEKFEKLRFEPGTFTHCDHLECAYAMLVKYPFIEATVRYLETIRQMAERAGADKKFNTTITIVFLGADRRTDGCGSARKLPGFHCAAPRVAVA